MKHPRLLFLLLLTSLSILLGLYFVSGTKAPTTDTTPKPFIINRGQTASQVGLELQKQGFIKNALIFKLITVVKNASRKIEAGEYNLPQNLDVFAVIAALQKGAADIWITIPEGLRKEEIATRFADSLKEIDSKKFIELTTSPKDLEGYLYPDTYLLPKGASSETVIKKLISTFDKKASLQLKNRTNRLTEYQTLILASLIEREAKDSTSRKLVSGILLKRLQSNWGLEVDATLQYIKASRDCSKQSNLSECKWWSHATIDDKLINSPYNTYKHPGLPPTPICNPGTDSISAAANPTSSPYWFYLTDNQGQMHYGETLKEHQANINRYLK